MTTLDLNGFATLFAYLGIVFLFGWWVVKSRTLLGLLFTLIGVGVILAANFSDHTPEHLAGLLVCVLVVGGLLLATTMLIRVRARRVRVYRPGRARRQAAAQSWAARQAAQAERQAPEISASKPATKRPATRRPTTSPKTRRGGYIVNTARK